MKGGVNALSQGFELLPTQRVPLFPNLRYPFLADEPLSFLKATSVTIFTNFEGEARAKKKRFWPVFSNFCLWRRKFGENRGLFSAF